ncbi:hypothetical protein TNIN_350521 [Trichonephila inaurata madagascariensis]|uniref:Uncharacterized protein n=1 Tax=Trichonephila inaurata madagascariensis TaxID=2747483 RepID=A0A8X6YQ81_9ARAC|nr:hypothetical protein TNIN_350521 [Trichonephila inaurata madagascariensis]
MRFANSILSKTKGWPFKLPSHILIAKELKPKLEESKHPSHVNGSRELTHAIAMNHVKSKGISISRKSCLETYSRAPYYLNSALEATAYAVLNTLFPIFVLTQDFFFYYQGSKQIPHQCVSRTLLSLIAFATTPLFWKYRSSSTLSICRDRRRKIGSKELPPKRNQGGFYMSSELERELNINQQQVHFLVEWARSPVDHLILLMMSPEQSFETDRIFLCSGTDRN